MTVLDATQACGWLPIDARRFDFVDVRRLQVAHVAARHRVHGHPARAPRHARAPAPGGSPARTSTPPTTGRRCAWPDTRAGWTCAPRGSPGWAPSPPSSSSTPASSRSTRTTSPREPFRNGLGLPTGNSAIVSPMSPAPRSGWARRDQGGGSRGNLRVTSHVYNTRRTSPARWTRSAPVRDRERQGRHRAIPLRVGDRDVELVEPVPQQARAPAVRDVEVVLPRPVGPILPRARRVDGGEQARGEQRVPEVDRPVPRTHDLAPFADAPANECRRDQHSVPGRRHGQRRLVPRVDDHVHSAAHLERRELPPGPGADERDSRDPRRGGIPPRPERARPQRVAVRRRR